MGDRWLEVGTIVAPQGLTGELRIYPNSDFPERFLQPGIRWIQNPQTLEVTQVELLQGHYLAGKNLYVIKLAEVSDRNQAEELRQYKLLVESSDRPDLAKDEYHVSDLIGLEVYHQQTGENIGVTIDLYSAGNDLLEVQLHQQPAIKELKQRDLSQISRKTKRKKAKPSKNKLATVFIPFVKEIVPVVDIKNNRIEITPPPGLLEINQDN